VAKKRKSPIRQTKTEFQKVFEGEEHRIEPVSWLENSPEVLHVSYALSKYSLKDVRKDFHLICDEVDKRELLEDGRFYFTLSGIVSVLKKDSSLLEFIRETVFHDGIQNILTLYISITGFEFEFASEVSTRILIESYASISDGRSGRSILCKFLMLERFAGAKDPTGLFELQKEEDILTEENVSSVMARFPIFIKLTGQCDKSFCFDIWMLNCFEFPMIHRPIDEKGEEQKYDAYKIESLKDELESCYNEFKKINLIAVFPQGVSEVKMGLIERIVSLGLDVVTFVKSHKGEVADIVLRSVYESYILLEWLLDEGKPENFQRFREFGVGKEKFMGNKLSDFAKDVGRLKEEGQKIAFDAVKNAGMRDAFVSEERGAAFDKNIAQMAEQIWGKDNMQYFLYKRLCETTHGHWRVIEKFHLSKSLNPMHRGMLDYYPNKFKLNGLTPAMMSLLVLSQSVLSLVSLIEDDFCYAIKERLEDLIKRVEVTNLEYLGLKNPE
jgi:hypothetical protein